MEIIQKVYDVKTGEVTENVIEESADDKKSRELFERAEAQKLQQQIELQAKRAETFAKLQALGLDETDLKALGL